MSGIDDQRSEPGSLGSLMITRVDGQGFDEWFSRGIRAIPGYTPEAMPLSLGITILKAYAHGHGALKSVNVVVRVRAATEDSFIQEKLYRGADDSMNWASSQAEVQAAFDRAMASLNKQISADLKHWCKNLPATASGVAPLIHAAR